MNKQVIIFILISILITINIQAQKWDHTYGLSNKIETCTDVIEGYDNGYLISGSYKIPHNSNWLIKTGINGSILWEKIITHSIYDLVEGAIDQNSDGEIAIARCINFDGGDQWPSLIKLDACGNKLWCRVYMDDDFSYGVFTDVILYENGDVLALSKLTTDGDYTDQIFLYYINTDGDIVWRESYASVNDHPLVMPRYGRKLQRFDDEYIISGYCYYPYPENPATGYMRPFFICIDTLFNEKWILPFGVNDYFVGSANKVIPLNDSVYMGVGFIWETGSDQNTVLMFFNSDGEELGFNQVYNEAIGQDINDNITIDVARLNDSLFITSTLYGPEAGLNAFGEFIIDTAANIYKKESRPNTRGTSTMVKTYDDKYVIGCNYKHSGTNYDIYLYKINDSLEFDTVYTANYTYDSLCPGQIESGTIDVSDCLLITDVGEVPTPKEYFAGLNTIIVKAYPNPATKGEITFEYQNTGHHRDMELRCFNMFGEEVYSENVYPYQGESKINIRDWKSGIYVGLVYSNGQVVGRTKFVVK